MNPTDLKPTNTHSNLKEGYSYVFIQKKDGSKSDSKYLYQHKYRFKTNCNTTYIVDVEEYNHDLFVLKFYLKNHSNSGNRYNYVFENSKKKRSSAIRIFNTCLNIIKEIYLKNSKSSFGVYGVQKNKKEESSINTQRFRIYKSLANNYFAPDKNFEHYENSNKSVYLLLNKNNETKNLKEKITEMFNFHYADLAEIL